MRAAGAAPVLLLLLVIQGAYSKSSPCAFADDVDYRCSLHESTCTDLSSGVVSDKESCCELCANDPTGRCTAAVWESWPSSQRCYLKRLPRGQQLADRRVGTVGCVLSAGAPTPPPSPPPMFPFRNVSLPIDDRVRDLVGRLTFDEKVSQMTRGGAAGNSPAPAIDRLGIAAHIWGTECATGLGSDDGGFAGTSFPQPLGLAATWDTDLVRRIGVAMHTELRAQHNEDLKNGVVKYHHGINCWSPVVNIMRHWGWGRNDETYGECPILSSAFAHAFVGGLQGNGDNVSYVAATAGCKHFGVGSGPDATRQVFDANVSLRDWSTTFMPAFESCVREGGLGLMCSFNSVRSVPACANHRGLTTWARDQWGYKGYVVSDQGAAYGIVSDHHYASDIASGAALAINAGLDLEDANDASHTLFSGIPDAVKSGLLEESAVDQAVSRLFFVRMRTGEFDPPSMNPYLHLNASSIRSDAHLALAREAAAKSLVLLKNENKALPLGNYASIALVGPAADCASCMFNKYSPHQDVQRTVTVFQALNRSLSGRVRLAAGCGDGLPCGKYKKQDVLDAVSTGGKKDAVLIAVGLGSSFESEDRDRDSLALPGHQGDLVRDAIAAAQSAGSSAVVLLFSAGPVDPDLFAGADAVLDCLYPAEMAGLATADVLLGVLGPGGRLPFSWPTLPTDVPPIENYTMNGRTYRYAQPNIWRTFGFGLTYTPVTYGAASVATSTVASCDAIVVHANVSNAANSTADAVVQLYVKWKSEHPSIVPALSLADFARVSVAAGDVQQVSLRVTPRSMAVLSAPRCGVLPVENDTALSAATALQNLSAVSGAACCEHCAGMEQCEAWTFYTASRKCQLFAAWARTLRLPGAVSGQPLPQWQVRPGTLELFFGDGQPRAGDAGILVNISGSRDVPLFSCQSPD